MPPAVPTLPPLPAPRSPGSIYVALDGTPAQSAGWVRQLSPLGVRFKVGLELYYRMAGDLAPLGLEPDSFFLDLKLHDIPNTVSGGLKALAHHRPGLINVHCSAGPAALAAAVRAFDGSAIRPRLLGVTVLTSLSGGDLQAVGFHEHPGALVVRLARLALDAGLDGVVCSGQEIELIKQACGPDFLAVVPGIRPAGTAAADQQRTLTPGEAYARGADALVIGRPITGHPDPATACMEIIDNINK